MFRIITSILLLVFCSACSPNIDEEIIEIESYFSMKNRQIDTIIDDNYVDFTKIGEGSPDEKSIVKLRYRGTYLDGEVFDDRFVNTPVEVKIRSLIIGLESTLPLLGKHGQGTIVIPSSNGFGNNPPRGIKESAILVYDIIDIDF
jgi:FKBP-type peptidyl-prolyl cis-trans isomerase